MTGSRARRVPVVAVILISFLVTGVLRYEAQVQRRRLLNQTAVWGASFNNLSAYSLALLLGGLRGAMVMMLWPSTESHKQEHDISELNTQLQLIRLLQPEYVSVYLYGYWNKAYNLSQQMASVSNKYLTILDALDDARHDNADRPNNINIVYAIGDLYFNKLGGSEEREYYTRRVRQETRWRPPSQVLHSRVDPHPLQLEPMLDAEGNILPSLLRPPPGYVSTGPGGNDGSALQYLKKYEPFPYGIPPLGLGYNYAKQAQVLETMTQQKHLQLSDLVIDSHPAISLKIWAEREYVEGLTAEINGFGKDLPEDPSDYGLFAAPTAAVRIDTPAKDPALLREAAYHYDLVARLADDATAEYERHLVHFVNNLWLYRGHEEELRARKALALADREFALAVGGPADQRDAHVRAARTLYPQAVRQWELEILRRGPSDQQAATLFGSKDRLESLTDTQIDELSTLYHRRLAAHWPDPNRETREMYEPYLARALERASGLR